MFILHRKKKTILKSTRESQCQDCDKPIKVGDEIVRVGNGLWLHEICYGTSNKNIKKINEKFKLLKEASKKFDLEIMNILSKIENQQERLKKQTNNFHESQKSQI